jgi:2-polyprenyl-6-methoxyphenol hydroxylase-like FAD-dependent oxidoreductase
MPRLNGPDYPAAIGIMRQALHNVLQQAMEAAAVPVRLGVTVRSLIQDDDGVTVHFTDDTQGRYDLVIGADGANSKIRELIFGSSLKPRYTGQAVWRATVNRPSEVRARISYHGPRNKAGFNPVSNEQMYIYLVQNLPEFVRLGDTHLAGVLRDLLADFGGVIARAREEIDDPDAIAYRPITSLIFPAPWYRGRVLLIGDAVHTTTPHMAAGAGIAVEDSVVLLVVDNSFQLGEWEKVPNMPGADPVAVEGATVRALAQPF